MWTHVALAVALFGAGQADQLTISNIRTPYGMFGPERPNNKILPGDLYRISFDVDGMKTDADGKVRYTLAMDVIDKSGKGLYSQPAKDQEAYLSLGGSRLPATMYFISKPDA